MKRSENERARKLLKEAVTRATGKTNLGGGEKKGFNPRPITLAHAEQIAAIKIKED